MKLEFLEREEYTKTKELASECFGSSEELDKYYEEDVFDNRIAVLKDNDSVISMVQLRRMIAVYEDHSLPVWYIIYVCTAERSRHLGYMDRVMDFVLRTLKKEGESFTFLVPTDKRIYEHLGFIHSWDFNEDEADLLYADEGLTQCFACALNCDSVIAPEKLKAAETVKDLCFSSFSAHAAVKYFDYFYIRPNKSCDSVPVDWFMWNDSIQAKFDIIDDRCFMITETDDGITFGCIPFCRESELVYYFKLQERYFNEVLKLPLYAYMADSSGVEYLRSKGALDNYEITQDDEIFDYIYSGDDLRTLSGRNFSNKRNRINKFERNYSGRWEYKSLGYENRNEILNFLNEWSREKLLEERENNDTDKIYNAEKTLEIDISGAIDILNSSELMDKIKVGGIFIDGKLCAFSIGSYNPKEKMAVIEIEKADPEIDGLYQLINREFLIHEFPYAEIVNREDDVGLPGLRKAKMSYNPICFEKKYSLKQKNWL